MGVGDGISRLLRRWSNPGLRVAVSIALAAALSPGAAHAQLTTATVEGVVTDESGGALPDANVEITNTETGVARTVVTDSAGRYFAPNLRVGTYEIVVTLQGFTRTVKTRLDLGVGRRAVIDIQMSIAGTTEEIVVEATSPLIETHSATVSYLVGRKDVAELPVINRDLTQLAFLQPGVIKSPAGQGVFSGQGDKLAVAGARGTQNLYLLDGVSNGDISGNPQGSSGVYNGSETIEEMQIITNNYSAEYRSAVGAIVSAITKSGTNKFHGAAFGYFRDDSLDAENFFDKEFGNPKPEFSRQHFGATLGGPVVKDKLHFFASYEGIREDLNFTDSAQVPSANARSGMLADGTVVQVHPTIQQVLQFYPVPGQGNNVVEDFGDRVLIAGTTLRETQNDYFVGKLDYAPSLENRFSVTYNYDKGERNRFGLVTGDDITAGVASRTQLLTGHWLRMLSDNSVNDFHIGWSDTRPQGDIPLTDFDFVGEGLIFAPTRSIMGELTTDVLTDVGFRVDRSSFRVRYFTLRDMLTLNTGNHELRIGGVWTRGQYNVFTCSRGCNGSYTFRGVENFLTGNARRFDILFPESVIEKDLRQNTLGLFVQDNWRVSNNLTLNLGVRYEYATTITEQSGNTAQLINLTDPETTVGPLYENPGGQFSPRVGFAWAPTDARWSLRGGFGIFYEHPNLFLIRTALAELPPFTLVGRIDARRIDDPIDFPNAGFTQIELARGRPNMRAFQFDLDQTKSYRWSLTYQRQFGQHYVATADYTGSRGRNLWGQNQANLCRWEGFSLDSSGFPNPVSGPKFFPEDCEEINPEFGSIRFQYSNQKSWYNGLALGFNRIASDLRFGLAYTFSKAIDQGSGVTSGGEELPQSQRGIYGFDLNLKQGLAAFDRRHQFVAHLGWVVGGGFQINSIVTFQSGYPLSVLELNEDQADRIGDDEALRPNLVPGGDPNPVTGNADAWFDVSQFQPSQPGFFGDVGRHTVTAPDLFSVDLSLLYDLKFGDSGAFLQLRAEVFNLFDRVNYGQPNMVAFIDGEVNPTAGRITSTATPARRLQLGVRLVF